MANFIFQRRWNRQQKPSIGSQINWGHPLAQGLVRALIINEQNLSPIWMPAATTGSTVIAGTPTGFPGKLGYGILCNNLNGDLVSWNFADLNGKGPVSGGGSYSLVTGFSDWTGFPDGWFFSITSSGGGSLDRTCIETGNAQAHDVSFSYRHVGDGSQFANSVLTYADGAAHTVVGALNKDNSGSQLAIMVDGIQSATASLNSFTGNLSGLDRTAIGGGAFTSGASNQGRSPVYFAYVYGRALSESEAQWLNVEPYAMFVAQSPRVQYFAPPTVDTVNIKLAYQL